MNSIGTTRSGFSTKPLVAAVALALAAPAAFADNGMPGAGLVVRNQGNINVNGVALPGSNQIIGLNSGDTINSTVGAGTVIQWGSPGVVDGSNKAGYNIAAGKTLNYTCAAGCGWLNIDISGNLSQIDGKIVNDLNSVFAVSNEKGITVGSGATIIAPRGLALIGSNMNTINAIDAFALAASYQLNFAGSSPVTVVSGANLTGVATYLLVAGSGSVSLSGANTKMPAATVPITVIGGVGSDVDAITGVVTINDTGPASGTVRSTAPTDVTIGLGTTLAARDATMLTVYANGNLTNTGNLDFLAQGSNAYNHLIWTGTLINTGTLQTTTVGQGLNFDNYSNTVPWYRNTAATQPFVGSINNSGTIMAADGYVNLRGNSGDMTNSGKISAGNGSLDFRSHDGNVTNTATGDITATGSVRLRAFSRAVSTNPHNVVNDGKITSTASNVRLRSEFGSVTNSGTGVINGFTGFTGQANYSTNGVKGDFTNAGTINLTGPDANVYIYNYGPGDQNVGGTIQAVGKGAYIGYFSAAHRNDATGKTTISTPISVLTDKGNTGIYLAAENIVVSSKLTVAEETVGSGAGRIEFFGSNSIGSNVATIGADLTAGNFYFSTVNGGAFGNASFDMKVNLNGNLTTTAGGSRTVEFYDVAGVTGAGVITANRVLFDTSGSVRNPTGSGAGPNNYLLNGLHITTVGTNPIITINERAPTVVAINLAINGNATVTSANTVVGSNPCYSGLCITPSGGYVPKPDSGSSLLITATGNLTVAANDTVGALMTGSTGGLSNTNGFHFPGGVAFVAGGTLNVTTVIDNAFTANALPFQGVFFEGAVINELSPIYTNGNAFVNYSVRPNGGVGLSTVYQAHAGTNFLGFPNLTAVINPNDSFLNSYTFLANALANGTYDGSQVSRTPIYQ